MNKSVKDGEDLAAGIKRELAECCDVDVVLCPPFTLLKVVGDIIDMTQVRLGAQNMHWESDGAFTGEISAGMLRDLFCHYVILGHSERRAMFGETNEVVNNKVKAALARNLTPIVCVGETLEERDSGAFMKVIESQVRESLAGITDDMEKLILAYEPVWAIGTGRTASPEQAQEVHKGIRAVLADLAGKNVADSIRIQYGGSVKPANAAELFSQPDIDGGLIGGAALDVRSFVEIVRAAM